MCVSADAPTFIVKVTIPPIFCIEDDSFALNLSRVMSSSKKHQWYAQKLVNRTEYLSMPWKPVYLLTVINCTFPGNHFHKDFICFQKFITWNSVKAYVY